MKKRYLSYLFLTAALVAGAQSKIDIAGARLLDDYRILANGGELTDPDLRLVGSPVIGTYSANSSKEIGSSPIGVLVTVKPEMAGTDITLGGVANIEARVSETIFVVSVPISKLEEFMEQDAVESVSVGFKQQTYMNNARPSGCVDDVHNGTGLDKAYKGSGVIVGMFDTGMDPNHVNFTKADDTSTTRVKALYEYNGSSGATTYIADTEAKIKGYTTDQRSESHGTHVMGIAAGAYKGPGTWRNGSTLYSNATSMPLYGVAPEADIVMAGGELYEANIISGVTKIVEYAESQNKPAVINLSLGSLLGSHDGLDSNCESLAELGQRAIICVATGNDAELNCAFTMQGGLTTQALCNTVGITPYVSGNYTPSAIIFNDSSDPFEKLEFVILNVSTKEAVYSREIEMGKMTRLGGSSTASTYEKPDIFSEAFTASSKIEISTGTYSSRNPIYAAYITHTLSTGTNSLLRPCFRITRNRGQVVYGVISNGEFTNNNITTTYTENGTTYAAPTRGTNNGSVSRLATGDNILTCGAYTSTITFGYLSKGGYAYTGHTDIDQMAPFSSYGKNMATGDPRPHVSAPGTVILSSYNTYWNITLYDNSSGTAAVNSKSYYWGPMQGTSMSTPFVTGVVALWLEADPNLTIDDVKGIVAATSRKTDEYNSGNTDKKMQWGAGAIDALAGIKMAIDNRTSIGSVWEDPQQRLIITQDENSVTAYVGGESALAASLFSITGATVAQASASGNEVTLSTAALTKGVYILSVQGTEGRYTRKIVVK